MRCLTGFGGGSSTESSRKYSRNGLCNIHTASFESDEFARRVGLEARSADAHRSETDSVMHARRKEPPAREQCFVDLPMFDIQGSVWCNCKGGERRSFTSPSRVLGDHWRDKAIYLQVRPYVRVRSEVDAGPEQDCSQAILRVVSGGNAVFTGWFWVQEKTTCQVIVSDGDESSFASIACCAPFT